MNARQAQAKRNAEAKARQDAYADGTTPIGREHVARTPLPSDITGEGYAPLAPVDAGEMPGTPGGTPQDVFNRSKASPILASAWAVLIEYTRARIRRDTGILTDMEEHSRATGAKLIGGRNNLDDAYHQQLDFAVCVTAELVELGYPPPLPAAIPTGKHVSSTTIRIPPHVFALQEMLRDAVYLLLTLRQMITAKQNAATFVVGSEAP